MFSSKCNPLALETQREKKKILFSSRAPTSTLVSINYCHLAYLPRRRAPERKRLFSPRRSLKMAPRPSYLRGGGAKQLLALVRINDEMKRRVGVRYRNQSPDVSFSIAKCQLFRRLSFWPLNTWFRHQKSVETSQSFD